MVGVVLAGTLAGCIRGALPAREYYRLTLVDSVAATPADRGAPALRGSIAVEAYETPGIYGATNIVYRLGSSEYGAYPSREWAIPLGEMLGMMTEHASGTRALTTDGMVFDPPARHSSPYVWRGFVREFEEVDRDQLVFGSVALAAQLIRASDDSVLWSGSVHEEARAVEARSMRSVVDALSVAASRALLRLLDQAALALGSTPAALAPVR